MAKPKDELPPPPPENEPHELFLPENEDDAIVGPPELAFVSVTRLRPYYDCGGKCWPSAELPDVNALRDRFGRGEYTIQARNEKRRVLAQRKITIARGPEPMPMDGEGRLEEDEKSGKGAPAAPAPTPHAGNDVAALAQVFDKMIAAQSAQTDKIVAMVTSSAQTLVSAMGQHYEAMAKVQAAAPASALVPASGGDEFRAGIDFGITQAERMLEAAAKKKEDSGGEDSVGDDIKQIGALVDVIAKLGGKTGSTGAPSAPAAS